MVNREAIIFNPQKHIRYNNPKVGDELWWTYYPWSSGEMVNESKIFIVTEITADGDIKVKRSDNGDHLGAFPLGRWVYARVIKNLIEEILKEGL